MKTIKIIVMGAAMILAACGTKKSVTTDPVNTTTHSTEEAMDNEQLKLNYMRKVYDNAVYARNIVSDIDFKIDTGSKQFSVGGSLHMRKDDVIRIQLTALGLMEVGRLEFTKDYVLIVDRIHKEYIKADYNKVEFLKRNGLNFYSMQALFWNMLFMPGEERVTDALLRKFALDVTKSAPQTPVTLKQDRLTYVWTTDSKSGLIQQTDVTYEGGSNGNTKVTCKYENFKPLGTKQYPNKLTLVGLTNAMKQPRNASIVIDMDGVKTSSDWEPRTTLSGKYKEVPAEEVLEKIMNL